VGVGWCVPDQNKAQDLERPCERSMLREFRQYAGGKGAVEGLPQGGVERRRVEGKRLHFACQAENILVQVIVQAESLDSESIYQRTHGGKQAGSLGA